MYFHLRAFNTIRSQLTMLGFHQRRYSLIPVSELSRYDVKDEASFVSLERTSYDTHVATTPPQWKQSVGIYALFLA